MAAITSAGSGNWNSTTPNAPWPSGVVPVSGDTVIIANGHTITIPTGYTAIVGSSPADDTGTPAIQTASATGTGILVMQDGSGLTYKGPIRQTNANWVIGAGCTIRHDSSGAAVPANANYTWQIGIAGSTSAKLTVNGVAGNRTTFGIAASSGKAGGFHQASTVQDCGQLVASYASFADWGTAAGSFCRPYLVTAATKFTLDHCLLDRCSKISAWDVRLASDFRVKNTSIRSPVASSGRSIEADGSGNGFRTGTVTGDWRLEHAYIDGQVSLFNNLASSASLGMHLVDVIITGTTSVYPFNASGTPALAEWNNVLLYDRVSGTGSPSQAPGGTMTRTIFLRTGGGNNPHQLALIKQPLTIDGFIAEVGEDTGSQGGDLFQTQTRSGSHYPFVVKHGLVIPEPTSGKAWGCIINHSDGSTINGTTVFGPQITLEHCTWPGDDGGNQCVGAGGELNPAFAGLYASVRGNLIWMKTAGLGWVAKWANSSTPVAGTYANADYNGVSNLTGVKYYRADTDPGEYTVTPGAHDVTAAPSFVDPTRKMLTFAQSLDGTVASWSDMLDRFSKYNDDAGSVAGLTISAAYDWIRAGWVPTNTALNTSYPGDAEQFMGIAAAVAAGPTAKQKLFYRMSQYAAALAGLTALPLSLFGVRHV